MALLSPLFLQALTGDTEISYTAQDFRRAISALAPNPGTIKEGDLLVGPRAAGANMSVDVAAGRAIVAGTSIADQGTYGAHSTAVENVPIAAADATNPRIDLIVARVFDKQADGGTKYGWQPLAVAGTPATSPAPPPVPDNSLVLAHVRVNAGAASIAASDITDKRVLSGTGDVPKWDVAGTPATAQSVPHATTVIYQPRSTFQKVGMSTAGMRDGEFQCLTPGRYTVHLCIRLSSSASTCNRVVTIVLYAADGTTVQRRIAATGHMPGSLPVNASGTIYMRAGERIAGTIYQDSGGALTVDDGAIETNFTGVWVGA